MKPVKNERTTPLDIGDFIISKWERRPHPTVFKIVSFAPCSELGRPCNNCTSGNIAYVVKKFNKRLGIRSWKQCPIKWGDSEWLKWEPREVRT